MTLFRIFFGGAWNVLKWAWETLLEYPWQAALIASLILCAWFYTGKQEALSTVSKRDQTISDMKAASAQNAAKQAKAINDRKSKETQIAKDSDNAYKVANLEAGAAATVYIDRWRVRDKVCSGGAVAAPESESAGVPEAMPADAVLVSSGDVQACTGATAYAIEAHNHAMRQIAEGVAE